VKSNASQNRIPKVRMSTSLILATLMLNRLGNGLANKQSPASRHAQTRFMWSIRGQENARMSVLFGLLAERRTLEPMPTAIGTTTFFRCHSAHDWSDWNPLFEDPAERPGSRCTRSISATDCDTGWPGVPLGASGSGVLMAPRKELCC
jgi:hypothetical protein